MFSTKTASLLHEVLGRRFAKKSPYYHPLITAHHFLAYKSSVSIQPDPLFPYKSIADNSAVF